MGTNLCREGFVSERLKAYHEARARGGVGLDIVENANVDSARGAGLPFGLRIDDAGYLSGLSELAAVIGCNGAKSCLQIFCGARCPQPHERPVMGIELPRELTAGEIQECLAPYARAARLAKEAGFDAVEIHAANMNLQTQFRSRVWNKRQDQYGGSVKNRARFLVETITAVRREVGNDYPLWCRISLFEVFHAAGGKVAEYGLTLEDTLEQAPLIEAAGVDALHISASGFRDYSWQYYTMCPVPPQRAGTYLDMTQQLRKVVTVPVIAAGRISPELGERAIRNGKADFVAMGRAIQVDPELPNKLAAGRRKEIRPCFLCNECIETLPYEEGVQCTGNPALGREREFEIKPAATRQKVVIVGGGPAGMEAARVAALRGHRVTLYEKEDRLGGQLLAAAVPPHKGMIRALTTYLSGQLEKLGVTVALKTELTPEEAERVAPDVIILATGARPVVPDDIPGLESLGNVVSAIDVLRGEARVGDRVLVIGGERVGCETAEFLASKGKRVTITRRKPYLADKLNPDMRMLLVDRLAARGVRMLPGVAYLQAAEEGIRVHTRGGAITSIADFSADRMKNIAVDSIVLAAGAVPNDGLLADLQGKAPSIHGIGDCVEPRLISDALREGWSVANEIGGSREGPLLG